MHESGRGIHLGNCVMGAVKMLSERIYADLIDSRALLKDWHALPTGQH